MGGDPDLVTIPELRNQSQREATTELQDLDLRVDLATEASDGIAAGFVIRTEPAAGEQVEVRSLVTIVVSGGPNLFPVPNVLGLTEEQARAAIEEQGFEVGEVTGREDQDVEEGLVLDQDPAPGAEAAAGTAVDLVLSAGPFALTVPPVEGLSETDAVRLLEEAGFEVEVEHEFSDEIEEGLATRTDPGAGQLVDRENPTVVLFISDGPEPFSLPSFIGLSGDEAEALAAQIGLGIVFEDPIDVSLASGLAGRVADQSPAAGTEVTEGDTVVVRLGQVRRVEVPELFGMTEAQAAQALDDVGLELVVLGTVPNDDPLLAGRVVGQDPPEGTPIEEGSEVGVQLGAEPATTTTTTTTTPP